MPRRLYLMENCPYNVQFVTEVSPEEAVWTSILTQFMRGKNLSIVQFAGLVLPEEVVWTNILELFIPLFPHNHFSVLSVVKDLLRKVALIRIFLLFMRGKNLLNVWLATPVLPVEAAWKNILTLCMKEKSLFIVPFVIPVLQDELAWKNMSALFIKTKITYHDIDVIFNILFISGQNGRSWNWNERKSIDLDHLVLLPRNSVIELIKKNHRRKFWIGKFRTTYFQNKVWKACKNSHHGKRRWN